MSKKISLKKNFLMNTILTMSSFIFPLITFPYVSRILGPTGTGKVQLATSWATYFNMIAQLGIPTYGVRACAQVRDNREELTRTAHELLTINMVLAVFAYAAFFALVFLNPKMRSEKLLYLIISSMILFNAIGMEWLYKGLEEYAYITKRSIAFKFVALIAMFVLIHSKSDYVIYGGISIFAASASNVMNFIHARKHIDMHPIGGYHYRRHLKAVGIFFAMSCATTVYTNLDTVMLGHMKTDADVGYYNAAVKIKNVLVSIVTSLGTVLLPRASYYVEHKEMKEFWNITKKALNFVVLFAAPMTLYFILYAEPGIYFLSGREYGPSIPAMQIIMPTLIFIGLTNILGIQVLVPLGREKTVLYSEIAGAVVDFIINLILIPSLASAGAAIGTLAAEFVVLVVQYRALKNEVAQTFREIHYFQILIALALGSAASLWVYLLDLSSLPFQVGNLIILVVSVFCFFGVYAGVLTGMKEPMVLQAEREVRQKLRRRK